MIVNKIELLTKIQFTSVVPGATRVTIRRHCEIASEQSFQAVIINPCWIPLAQDILHGAPVEAASAVASMTRID